MPNQPATARDRSPLIGRRRQLARHALGLDGVRRESYRNRFHAAPIDAKIWGSLVLDGFAERGAENKCGVFFYLTTEGALRALDPGERLDKEDFPDAAH